MIPAITYFRTCRHYHRPQELNCRVRNGNECGLLGKFTGKLHVRQLVATKTVLNSRTSHAEHADTYEYVQEHAQVYKNGSGRVYLKL